MSGRQQQSLLEHRPLTLEGELSFLGFSTLTCTTRVQGSILAMRRAASREFSPLPNFRKRFRAEPSRYRPEGLSPVSGDGTIRSSLRPGGLRRRNWMPPLQNIPSTFQAQVEGLAL